MQENQTSTSPLILGSSPRSDETPTTLYMGLLGGSWIFACNQTHHSHPFMSICITVTELKVIHMHPCISKPGTCLCEYGLKVTMKTFKTTGTKRKQTMQRISSCDGDCEHSLEIDSTIKKDHIQLFEFDPQANITKDTKPAYAHLCYNEA